MDCLRLFEVHVRGLKERTNGQVIGHCPFHDDRNRSWSGNIGNGLWICYAGCGSGNAYQFAERLDVDPSSYITTSNISNKKSNQLPKYRGKSIAKADLTNEALDYVEQMKKCWDQLPIPMSWSKDIVFNTGTGWDKKSMNFTFSHMDVDGNVINIHWHKGRSHSNGDGSCKWFPLQIMAHFNMVRLLLICEGEKDCLSLLSRGVQAITATTGASSVPKDLSPLKSFNDIVVLYDNDKAGRDGSLKMAQAIKSVFGKTKVRVAYWQK